MYEGYMTYGGVEIVNSARAKVYAENGIVPTSVELNCGCDTIAEAVGDPEYTSPIIDQPPWYDAADPYPNDFAGVVPLEVTGLSGSTRKVEVMERLGDGGIPVRGRATSRTIAITAALVGRSAAGVEAGLNWLSATLHPPCAVAPSGCGGATLEMFAACPETCEGQTDPDADPVTTAFVADDLRPLGGDIIGSTTPSARHNLVTHPSFELQTGGEGTAPDGWTAFDVGQNGTITYNQVAGDGVTSQNYCIDFAADDQGYGGPSGTNLLPDPGFESGLGNWTGVNGASLARTSDHTEWNYSTPFRPEGSYNLKTTWPGASGFPAASNPCTGFTIGQPYTMTAWVYAPTGSPDVRLQVFGVTSGTPVTVKDLWVEVQVNWLASDTTQNIQLIAMSDDPGYAGTVCYMDDIEVVSGYPSWNYDGGLKGWGATNGATVERTDQPGAEEGQLPHNSAAMMRVVWPTGGYPAAQFELGGLVVGQPYTYTAWVYVPAGSVDVALSVWLIGESTPMVTKTGWTQLQMSFIASATSHWVQVVPKGEHSSGEVCYVDDVSISAGTYTFTDGFGLYTNVDASPGTSYFGSVDLTLVNLPGGHDAALYLIPKNVGGTALAAYFAVGDPATHQQTLTISPFVAPANTDHIEVSLRLYGNGGGWEISQPVEVKWDSMVVASGSVFPYFDGATTDTDAWEYTWDAATNASASTATAVSSSFIQFQSFGPHQDGTVSLPWLGGLCDEATVTWDVVNNADYPITLYADAQDSPGQVVVAQPSVYSHSDADVLNPAALDGWFSDLEGRDSTQASIVFLGDSVTEGLQAGTYDLGFQRLFRHRSQERYPVANLPVPGVGWIPASNIAPTAPTTLAGDPTLDYTSGRGLGVKCLRVAVDQSVTWPQAWCDQIRVIYSHATASAGRGTISIDGVDQATIQSSAGSNAGGQVWDSGPLDPGPHVLSIRGIDASPVILSGAEFFYGDDGKGIHIYDAGHSGAQTDTFLGAGPLAGHWDDYEALQPNLTVINVGMNGDWSNTAQRLADIDSIIDECDTRSDRGDGRGPRPVVLVVPYRPVQNPHTPEDDAAFDDWCDGLRARATGHVAVYDLRAHWPTLVENGGEETGLMYEDDYPLHPNAAGHDYYADLMMTAVAPELTVVYGTTLPVDGTVTITLTVDPTPGFPQDWTSTLHTDGDVAFHVSYDARPEIALADCVSPLVRTYRNVVTVAGPTEVARYADNEGETLVSKVEWTMVAGEPYAYGAETAIAVSVDSSTSDPPASNAAGAIVTAQTSVDYAGTLCEVPAPPTVYCNDDPDWMGLPSPPTYPSIVDTTAPEVIDYWRRTVQFPNPPGVAALVLVVTSDAQAKKGLRVRVWHEDDCDLTMPAECSFDYEFTVDYLPPSSTLIIDSASGTATATCADGSIVDHTRNLRGNYGGPFQFPLVGCGDCTRVAVDVPKNYVSGGIPGLAQGAVVWSAYMAHRMG